MKPPRPNSRSNTPIVHSRTRQRAFPSIGRDEGNSDPSYETGTLTLEDVEKAINADDKSFKTTQYIEALRGILRERDNNAVYTPNKTIDRKQEKTPRREIYDAGYHNAYNGYEDRNDIYSNDDDEKTAYEYHLNLPDNRTEVSSLTDTIYTMSSKERQKQRKELSKMAKRSTVSTISTASSKSLEKREMYHGNKSGNRNDKRRVATPPYTPSAEAAVKILYEGGSFESAVKTVSKLIDLENRSNYDSASPLSPMSPITTVSYGNGAEESTTGSFMSRGVRRVAKKLGRQYMSPRSSKNSGISGKSSPWGDKSMSSELLLESEANKVSYTNVSGTQEAVQAWAVVAVSAAASVLKAGGSRDSAQAASAAVLSSASPDDDSCDPDKAKTVCITAAAQASAAVLASGSNKDCAAAAAIAVLKASESFGSTSTTPIGSNTRKPSGGSRSSRKRRDVRNKIPSHALPDKPTFSFGSRKVNKARSKSLSRESSPMKHITSHEVHAEPLQVARSNNYSQTDSYGHSRSWNKADVRGSAMYYPNNRRVRVSSRDRENLPPTEHSMNRVSFKEENATYHTHYNVDVDNVDSFRGQMRSKKILSRIPTPHRPAIKINVNDSKDHNSAYEDIGSYDDYYIVHNTSNRPRETHRSTSSSSMEDHHQHQHLQNIHQPTQRTSNNHRHNTIENDISVDSMDTIKVKSKEEPQKQPSHHRQTSSSSCSFLDQSFKMRDLLSVGSSDFIDGMSRMRGFVKSNLVNCTTSPMPRSP